MHRFHVPHLAASPGLASVAGESVLSDLLIELGKEESHHAAKVLRLRVGEAVALFDGAGLTAQGVIERLGSRVAVRLHSAGRVLPLLPSIDVAVALPKGARADVMIEQLSQLGCDRIIPLRTRRSIVDPRETKLDRFARAAIESAKQCGRAHVMTITPPMNLGPALWKESHDLRLIASPIARINPLLEGRLRTAQRVLILIGPEGGWAEEELVDAEAAGCEPWSLGPHVMRIETAATTAVAVARYVTQ